MVEILLTTNPAETNTTPAFFPFVNGSYQQPPCLTHTLLTHICTISGPEPEPGNYMTP
ncbi:Uncharacterized protein LW94_8089 [Fusarium fujikuroi]|nr:Uncharacterized protein LW93_13291 [Fusarium fujikuroi]KLP10800.1 Uncharacterized protein Y057_2866 [Fusarium fujikuroi]KLP16123.1 Uncharacterized protein LW94_8089 [Fusarium fujikuroi]